jgi:hypothetical protein
MKLLLLSFLFLNLTSNAQRKWPVSIFLPEYGVYLSITNDVNLNDTATIKFSATTYFKFFFFDTRGKSYCETYRNNKLYEKGYYENSLDTLKKYSVAIGDGKSSNYRILRYFQPLKHGEWWETVKGKLVKKEYDMGILLKNSWK